MEGFPIASMKQLFVMNFHKGVPIAFNIYYHAEYPKKRGGGGGGGGGEGNYNPGLAGFNLLADQPTDPPSSWA